MIVTVLPEPGAKNTDSAWRTEIGIHIATRTHTNTTRKEIPKYVYTIDFVFQQT